MVTDGALVIDPADEVQAGVVVAHDGQVVNPAVAKLLHPAERTGGADDVDRAGN
jgi:NAD(P) transhydrogenase subunit alpha